MNSVGGARELSMPEIVLRLQQDKDKPAASSRPVPKSIVEDLKDRVSFSILVSVR